jgi:hypothetical protein
MNAEQPPPEQPPPPRGLALPDSLLTIETVEQAINEYIDAGLRPILIHAPVEGGLCTCGQKHELSKSGSSSSGKHPIAKNWQKHNATRDELIDQRSRLKFTPNVGMVLGAQQGGEYIIAVDVDDLERFAELEVEFGALPETARCDSGRGYRLFYVLPSGIDPDTLKNVTALGGKPGLDVKCERGQVVVAPSLHANGKRYVWTRAGTVAAIPMTWALELVQAPKPPAWVAKYTPQTLSADGKAKKRAERYFEVAVTRSASNLASCGHGMRNDTLHRSARDLFMLCANSYLGGSTWSYVHNELSSAARACGLKESEIRATLASAEKWVVETGAVRVPVALSNPETTRAMTVHSADQAPQEAADPVTAEPARELPIIKVTTETMNIVEASIAALRADPNLYQRDKRLTFIVRVIHEQEIDINSEDVASVEGEPETSTATRPIINGRLSRVATYHKWIESAGGYKEVKPPEDVVAYINDYHEYPGIRPIIGITETPLLRPDGVIVQEPGYDPKTRYVYLPNQSFPIVHDEMATQENAQWAFKLLSEIFADFPYVGAPHLSVPIAAILTLIARPAILGSVPGFLFDASTRGSGKTLQADAIATVATGRGASRMNYPPKDEEMEKVLAGYALKSSPLICLDNIPAMCAFGGGPLDRVLTAKDKVDLRVLGHSDVPSLTWRAVIMATGNNIGFRGDTARRVLMARLEPSEENPERRTKFKYDDLLAYVRVQRPRLVAAALLILRAYFRAGCPAMGVARWGSFEEWSRLVPNAIVFAGGADPMKARPENDQDVDPEAQALSTLLMQLPKLIEKVNVIRFREGRPTENAVPARTIISTLYEPQLGSVAEWAELDPLKEAIEFLCRSRFSKSDARPDPGTLGLKLKSVRKRVIGGMRLTGATDRTGTMMWWVEKINNSV